MAAVASSHFSVLPKGAPITTEEKGGVLHVHVPKYTEVTLIEKFQRRDPEPYTTMSRMAVHVEDGARVKHYKLVLEGAHADHQSSVEVMVGKDAAFYSNVFLMGGEHIRNSIQVRLAGDNGECVLNGLYVGNGKMKIETHTLIDHQRPHGTSREFYKGILDDEAVGLFDGLIIVAKEAQKTDSSQTNKNLLISSKAKANSVPELKIFANDVKCKHGSTIGQLDPQQFFYLRSRGIPAEEARRLLINAFASEMIELVEIDELKASLLPCLNLTTSIRK